MAMLELKYYSKIPERPSIWDATLTQKTKLTHWLRRYQM